MIPPNPIRTGGEIDAFCTKCNLNLAHTIIAMVDKKVVKVKCNTCDSEHVYRGEQPLLKAQSFAAPRKSSAGPRAAPRAPKAAPVVVSWEDRFKGKDLTRAKKYSPKETFAVDEVVDHPTFGLGLVTAVRGDKIEVGFKQVDKTLVHGKGGGEAPAAKPTFSPLKGPVAGPADKVPGSNMTATLMAGVQPTPSAPAGGTTQESAEAPATDAAPGDVKQG